MFSHCWGGGGARKNQCCEFALVSMRIRIQFFFLNPDPDPDPASQTNADPDLVQALKSQS